MAFALRVAISLSTAIGHLHQRGVIHKDIKPANVLVNSVTGQASQFLLESFEACRASVRRLIRDGTTTSNLEKGAFPG
jgi:serine/threonine protein kinase